MTAYTAFALAAGAGIGARAAAERAFDLLCSRRPLLNGWSYNQGVPPDADTTIWVLRLAHALNRAGNLSPAIAFLNFCAQTDGGLATYPSDQRVRRAMRFPADVSFSGWLSSHACVTAAAASLQEFGARPETRAYLRRTQQADGRWDGYWWHDPEYSTALAVEALRIHGTAEDTSAIRAAVAWTRERPVSVSPFVLACRIRILGWDDPEACLEIAGMLAGLQNSDGSWPSSARIRIPPPPVLNPESIWNWDHNRTDVYSIRGDQERIFTTATVLNALHVLL